MTFDQTRKTLGKSWGTINTLFVVKLLKLGSSLGGLIIGLLLIWRRITWLREPKWLRNSPSAPAPELLAHVYGCVMGYVTKGDFCRRFMRAEQPDMVRFHNGLGGGLMRDFVLIKDPQLARSILKEKNTRKPEKGYRTFKRLTGYKGTCDFLSADSHKNPVYSRNRGVVYNALMRRSYNNFDTIFVRTVGGLIQRIRGNSCQKRDVYIVDEMHLVATSLITRVAFDEHSDNFDKSLFDAAIWMINDMMERPQNNGFKFLDDIPTPWNLELKRRQKVLVDTIEGMIANKRKKNDSKADDVISTLLKIESNTDEDILGILSIFFFAGFDTTSNSMSLILYHLAQNEDVQEKCRSEIFKVIGKESVPKMQQLYQLEYVEAVIKETLRMFPTVPMVAREVTENHSNGVCPRFNEESSFGVTINFFGLHYNPKGWNRPNEFLPERWLNNEIDKDMDQSQRVYCPFALGKRACLGRQFANLEMLTVVSMILQNFRLSPVKGSSLGLKESGTLIVDRNLLITFENIEQKITLPLSIKSNQEQVYSREEVAKHSDPDDLWIIFNSKVYDVTEYAARSGSGSHPGGNEILLALGGSDVTADFDFAEHSKLALKLLEKFQVGIIRDEEKRHVREDYTKSASSGRRTFSVMATNYEVGIPLNNG